jgi:hypothetical protein
MIAVAAAEGRRSPTGPSVKYYNDLLGNTMRRASRSSHLINKR